MSPRDDAAADLRPAGFWRRYAAWSLDAAIVAVPVLAITWPRTRVALQTMPAAFDALASRMVALLDEALLSAQDPLSLLPTLLREPHLRTALDTLQSTLSQVVQPALMLFVAVAAVYWIGCERSPWQATPGKRALRLRVTDRDRQRLGLARAALRHVAGVLSWLTLNLGHLWAALPPERRALHDHLAGTRVLQAGNDQPLPAWARAWIAVQALLAFATSAWLLRTLSAALQRALESAL